eukprot:CAMPEP_0119532482 /NCGR_PEP_ID=MMETSP1344-20130328/46004_1 /TAXON_ID=236787 /ORGANISM="Florenciella parvula, Strain CCMP2471" /LENGTH=280 /DNA_ID=CAMNT_0007573017 /DNA_START=27 /DNA_END=869 /DNA_ORIENTATION=+
MMATVEAGSCSLTEAGYYTTCAALTTESDCEAKEDSDYCVWCPSLTSDADSDSCQVLLDDTCTYSGQDIGGGCATLSPSFSPTTLQPTLSLLPTISVAPTALPTATAVPTSTSVPSANPTSEPTTCQSDYADLASDAQKCTNKDGKTESKCTSASTSRGSCEYCDSSSSELGDGQEYSATCALLLDTPCTISSATYGEGCSSLIYNAPTPSPTTKSPTASASDDDEEVDMTGIIAGSVVGAVFLCITGSLAWAKSQGRICKKPKSKAVTEMGPQAGNGAV